MSSAPGIETYQTRLTAALLRRKYDPMPPLELVLSIGALMDHGFCASVSDELHRYGRRWEVRNATPHLWEQLPQKSGLYMFVLAPTLRLERANPERGEKLRYALYVGKAGSGAGQSSSLRSRYKADYRSYLGQDPDLLWAKPPVPNGREGVLRKYLNLHPLEYWYLEIAELDIIDRMESSLIKLLNPPLNFQGKIKLRRSGETVPAFSRGE